jgi:hypothetical protein
MNRIKLVAVSAITAAMILGSTLVFASAPAADSGETTADQSSVTTQYIVPLKRGGGGAGHNLKK